MSKKAQAFTVMAELKLVCGITIKAESLEDAVQQSRDLKESDFVDFKDEFIDGDMKVTGVYEVQ
jgi:hypothetical protein